MKVDPCNGHDHSAQTEQTDVSYHGFNVVRKQTYQRNESIVGDSADCNSTGSLVSHFCTFTVCLGRHFWYDRCNVHSLHVQHGTGDVCDICAAQERFESIAGRIGWNHSETYESQDISVSQSVICWIVRLILGLNAASVKSFAQTEAKITLFTKRCVVVVSTVATGCFLVPIGVALFEYVRENYTHDVWIYPLKVVWVTIFFQQYETSIFWIHSDTICKYLMRICLFQDAL